MKAKRTIAYIDGFNLYFGLSEKGWRKYYWLNLWKLCHNFTVKGQNQQLIQVKYFTSRIKRPNDKRRRQNAYLRALGMTEGIERIYGKYIDEPHECPFCNKHFSEPSEKMTDVQLASHLLLDSFKDRFDTAIVVSGDRDLVPSIEICMNEFPNKRIVVVFPPMRACDELRIAHAFYHVTEIELKNSIFPLKVTDSLGHIVTCPPEWI